MGMVKMVHMNLYGPGRDPQPTLELLAKLECFQPDEPGTLRPGTTQCEDAYGPLLQQAAGLLKDLGEKETLPVWDGRRYELEEVQQKVERFAAEVAQRGKEKAEIAAKLSTYEQAKAQLYHLTGLQTSMDEIFGCQYLKVRFGRLPKDSYVKLPYYENLPFTFREYDFDGEYYWGMYFVPQASSEEVDNIFASLYFERMWVPDFVHGTPQDALAQIMADENDLQAQQKELDDLAAVASPEDIAFLKAAAAWLNYESQLAQMHRYVILLENSYYISGFVPQDQVSRLKDAVGKELPDVRANTDEEVGAKGTDLLKPPTKLKNNWFAKPFEMFIDMYGLPGYGDIDPTSFVAVTYAILFGVMFGDVGQGVLLGLIAYFIMYKKMHMQLGQVVARCSIFSVLFGFVYGSVFGFEHALDPMYRALGFAEKPLEVMEPGSINAILISSIAAGVFIIAAAIVTGIISNLRRGIVAKTLLSVNGVSGLVFYLALILLLLPMLGVQLPFVGSVPYCILFLGVPFVCMYFSEPICELLAGRKPGKVGEILINGFFEMFDAVLSFASNTMSFLRVGGFVLAHAGMMTVVFTLANMTSGVPYVLIVIVGNLFVMALEALFVGIQVLRLEFYEIFSRFFEATGAPFTPLRVTEGLERAA